MAGDASRAAPRSAPVRERAARIRRPRRRAVLARLMQSPHLGWALVIATAFVAVCSVLAIWTREQPLVAVGRVVNGTAISRVSFTIEDLDATKQARDDARLRTPRVYVADQTALNELESSLVSLPKALAGAERVEDVAPEIREPLRLTPEGLEAIKGEAVDGEAGPRWTSRVAALVAALRVNPQLDAQTWQREMQEGLNASIELVAGQDVRQVPRNNAINAGDPAQLEGAVRRLAREAGFGEPVLQAVVSRLVTAPRATFVYDPAATAARQNAAAQRIGPMFRDVPAGTVIFSRGDVLNPAQYELYVQELARFRGEAERVRVWLRRTSVVGAVGAVTLAALGYVALFCPRIARNPGRMTGLAVLAAGALAVACLGTAANPALLMLAGIAPTILLAVLLVIAYDQRVALALGLLHGVIVCIALDQPIGVHALILTGVGMAVWHLKEVRDRRTLVMMGLWTGVALAFGTVLVALIDRPIIPAALPQTLTDAGLGFVGGLLTGVLTLAALPTIERAFDITTGMKLIELRDPKQPLLRQLQQRAPGTYNHSLNVASIAEAAAEAVHADGLLTYVGALYHDIGKMNKPDYFIENQLGGPSRHDKLSPAMSLLVIVGHVKDGMALAQEYGLPRSLQHFIESHHGTTLVEFFYQRARQQAERGAGGGGAGPDIPEEVEYRYPGPKPRTREAAILMLADAVESATRTMAEPTPGRIEAMVRALASRRLTDGQFDDCDLTLRELTAICDSIAKTLASIYHGRIVYQSTAGLAKAGPVVEEQRA